MGEITGCAGGRGRLREKELIARGERRTSSLKEDALAQASPRAKSWLHCPVRQQ
jgi:hypothetical protein